MPQWEDDLNHYLIRSKNLFDRDQSIREHYRDFLSESFMEYIDTEAIIYFLEIAEKGPPFPPWEEMLTVGGETDIRKFLKIGYGCFKTVLGNLAPYHNFNKNIRLLDFGVGCGRIARFFYRHINKIKICGCDVDKKAINWLQLKMNFIDAKACNNEPPLPYAKNSFDAAYSISVFSHLNASSFTEWIKEMRRIIKPGGVLLITIHGYVAFDLLSREPERRKLINIREDEFNEANKNFYSKGFSWLHQNAGSEEIDTTQYGISFYLKDYLDRLLESAFSIKLYNAGELGGWQDVIVLQ